MEYNENSERAWKLLGVAQGILQFGDSVQRCMRVPRGKVLIVRDGSGHVRYDNLVTCKSAWSCPLCSPKIAHRKAKAIKEMHKQLKHKTCMITYTVQHTRADKLADLLNVLYDSLRHARIGRRHARFSKVAHGYIRSTEITYSDKNGFHPHIHELIYLRDGATIEHINETIVADFKEAVELRGKLVNQHTVKSDKWNGETSYITKNSSVTEVVGWVTKESKYSINIFGILERAENEDRYKILYNEYYYATKRRKVTMVSRSLMEQYKEQLQQVIEQEKQDDIEVLAELEREEWKSILNSGLRYQILLTLSGSLRILE